MLKTINLAALQFSQTLPEATLIVIALLLRRLAYREIVPLIKTKKTRTSKVYHPVAVGSKAARGSADASRVGSSWDDVTGLVRPLPATGWRLWHRRGQGNGGSQESAGLRGLLGIHASWKKRMVAQNSPGQPQGEGRRIVTYSGMAFQGVRASFSRTSCAFLHFCTPGLRAR